MARFARNLAPGLLSDGYSKSATARLLGVSRSSLYYKPKMPAKDEELRVRVSAVLERHPAYGHRRIALHLKIDRERVLRIMRRFGLAPRAAWKRKRPRNNGPNVYAVFPNVKDTLCPIAPDAVWAGDFTELVIEGGRRVFFATVLDTFTREILGWSLGRHHTSALVIEALEAAKKARGRVPGIFHSDQGSEYTGRDCVDWLLDHGVRPSMSPKASPWKNGRQESFYGKFKGELGDPRGFTSVSGLFEAIAGMVAYYNEDRISTPLKMPPRRYYELKRRPPRQEPWQALPPPRYRWDP